MPTCITYNFVDGTSVEVEVGREWTKVILDMRRKANSSNRLARMHCVTMDVLGSEGPWMKDEKKDEPNLRIKINQTYKKPSPKQQELVRLVCLEDMPVCEYARREGVDHSAISHRLEQIRKKFKKVLN